MFPVKDFGCSLSVGARQGGVSSFAAFLQPGSVPAGNVMHPMCLLQVQPPHQPELRCPALQPGRQGGGPEPVSGDGEEGHSGQGEQRARLRPRGLCLSSGATPGLAANEEEV